MMRSHRGLRTDSMVVGSSGSYLPPKLRPIYLRGLMKSSGWMWEWAKAVGLKWAGPTKEKFFLHSFC